MIPETTEEVVSITETTKVMVTDETAEVEITIPEEDLTVPETTKVTVTEETAEVDITIPEETTIKTVETTETTVEITDISPEEQGITHSFSIIFTLNILTLPLIFTFYSIITPIDAFKISHI